MLLPFKAAPLALLLAYAAACAQEPMTASASASAADPAAPVPPLSYRSALAGYRAAPPDASRPDENWLALNRTAAASDAMAGMHGDMPAEMHMGQGQTMDRMADMHPMAHMHHDRAPAPTGTPVSNAPAGMGKMAHMPGPAQSAHNGEH